MWIFDNLLYKVVAFVVATLLWAAAQGVTDAELSLDMPISVENVPEDLVVVEQSANEINLRLSGSRAALRQARKTLVRYPISLAGVRRGESRFTVTSDGLSLPRGAEDIFRSPSSIVFRTESVETRTVPIRADIIGTPPKGLRLGEISVDPPEVTLAGAHSQIRRVSEVLTDRLDVSRLRETTTLTSTLMPAGVPHVWPKLASDQAIRVTVVIEPVDVSSAGPPAAPASVGRARTK